MKDENAKFIIAYIEAQQQKPNSANGFVFQFDLCDLRIGGFVGKDCKGAIAETMNHVIDHFKQAGYSVTHEEIWYSFVFRGCVEVRKIV